MDYTQKRESWFCLENATKIQIQDMFQNGIPDIVMKTGQGLVLEMDQVLVLELMSPELNKYKNLFIF